MALTAEEIESYRKNFYPKKCDECITGLVINTHRMRCKFIARDLQTTDIIRYNEHIIYVTKEVYICKICNSKWDIKDVIISDKIYYVRIGPLLTKAQYSKIEGITVQNFKMCDFVSIPEIGNAITTNSENTATSPLLLLYFNCVIEQMETNIFKLSDGTIFAIVCTEDNEINAISTCGQIVPINVIVGNYRDGYYEFVTAHMKILCNNKKHTAEFISLSGGRTKPALRE